MSAPEKDDDDLLVETLAAEVVKAAVLRFLEDADPSDFLLWAPEHLGIDNLIEDDYDRLADLVWEADVDVEVSWRG